VEPDIRKVLISREAFEAAFARMADGRAFRVDWGQPDADGHWTPLIHTVDPAVEIRNATLDEVLALLTSLSASHQVTAAVRRMKR